MSRSVEAERAPRPPRWPYPVFFLLLSFVYTLPLFLKYDWWGVRDWEQFTTLAAIPATSLLDFGQFPFWNPWVGGGNIFFHHPEAGVLTPFVLLYLAFGAVVGLKLQVWVCLFLGLWGSHRLFVRLGISAPAAAMAAVAYFGSVHFALHFAEGHMSFTHFCFLPWLLYYLSEDSPRLRSVVLGAVALALMVLGSGAGVPLLWTLTLCVVWSVLRAMQTGNPRLLGRVALTVALGLMLAAVKFVPMLVYAFGHPWPGSPGEFVPAVALASIFLGFDHSLFAMNFEGQLWAWHEYGAYVSPILIALAAVGLVRRFRATWVWLGVLIFFLLLGLGNFGLLSPWSLLSALPGFASARCTARSFQFVILALAVLGGFGFDALYREATGSARARAWRYLLALAATVVVVTNVVLAWPIMASAMRTAPETIEPEREFTHVLDESPRLYENFLANRGSLTTPWFPLYHPARGLAQSDGTVLREYIKTGSVQILRADYAPNRIEYELTADTPGEMVIGMGYDPGWRVRDDREVRSDQGLILVSFDSGKDEFTLTYRPPYLVLGLILSLLALAVSVWLWRRCPGPTGSGG